MSEKADLLLIKTHGVRVTWTPLGLMYVAAGAEKSGARVRILDLSSEIVFKKALESALKESQPRLVGIGGMYNEFEAAKEIAAFVKKMLPRTPLVVGGPLAGSLMKECLAEHTIDSVVLREGESTIQELLRWQDGRMPLSEIKGIAYRGENQEVMVTPPRPPEDINAIPIPAWHLIDPYKYIESRDNWFGIERLRVMNIVPARGCPYQCIFCDKNVFGNKWRGRDARNIVDEMIMLRDTYGAQAIQFMDDIFDVNKKWVLDFIEEKQSRAVEMYWGCSSRTNHADYDLYKKMHKSGCRYIFLGIEFGSDAMLEKSGKQATVEQACRAIAIAQDAGLRVVSAYMMGMLDETEEQINETIKFALSSNAEAAGVAVLVPLAGTPLFEMGVEVGRIDPHEPWWKATRANAFINLTGNVSNKRLAYLVSKVHWMLFWSRPNRKWPRLACKIMEKSFYIIAPLAGDRFMDLMLWLDKIRRNLRIGLP